MEVHKKLKMFISRQAATIFIIIINVGAVVSAPVNSMQAKSFHMTVPSRVNDKGTHLSYNLQLSPGVQRKPKDLFTSPSATNIKEGRTYFKLSAFGETIFLNLTLNSDLGAERALVEYVRKDGSIDIRTPHHHLCHYTGHVHGTSVASIGGRIQEELGRVIEGSWTALSTCNGLHGVIITDKDHLFIEPSPFVRGVLDNKQHHTITKGPKEPLPTQCGARVPEKDGEASKSSTSPQDDYQENKVEDLKMRNRRFDIGSESFIETVVVADESMIAYHQQEDELEAYIFTLMNMVSHLYKDASIGHSVKVVLLRVIILESKQQNFSDSSSSHHRLDDFCSWMAEYNNERGLDNDIAVLLTRDNICKEDACDANTLGMADIGTACETGKNCNINKDRGLSTAFIIAHEIGHNLGIYHDGDPMVNCISEDRFIMAPSFTQSINPHLWSKCSQQQLADFLSSPQSSCLFNHPPDTAEWFTNGSLLPGMEYTSTEQCQLHLGANASHCSGRPDECAVMYCRVDNNSECVNVLSPLAPGTECNLVSGGMGVCYQGNCVQYKDVETPIDGGWGQWKEWTNCSLECGTGIQYRDRECDSPVPRNGGQYCRGKMREYQTCNQDACEDGMDTRQHYCEINPPNTEFSSWKTVNLDKIAHLQLNMCRSHCFPTDSPSIIYSSGSLPDGSPCLTPSARSQGHCLSSRCIPVSCSGELGVQSPRDECGVWCGNGTSCMKVAGSLDIMKSPGTYRYYHAVTIPAGSTHITAQEVAPSQSSFLVLQAKQTLMLERQAAELTFFAGSPWTIEYSDDGSGSLHTIGPIDEDLLLYVLTNEVHYRIYFTFNLLKANIAKLDKPVYFWNQSQWEDCNVTCRHGHQEREVTCWRLPEGNIEEDTERCNLLSKLSSIQDRSVESCQYHWVVSEWDSCNVSCGEGVKRRKVTCECKKGDINVQVDKGLCPGENIPDEVRPCEEACTCKWRAGDWGGCDAHCGEGLKEREVWCECKQRERLSGITANPDLCGSLQPQTVASCNFTEPCSNFQWNVTEWSECNSSCGQGSQVRTISCIHQNGTELPSRFCSWDSPPITERYCIRECTTPTLPPTTSRPPTPRPCSENRILL